MSTSRDGGQRPQPTLDEVFAAHGVHVRPLHAAIALLRDGWRQQDELVRTTALPRRSMQDLLAALADDLEYRDVRPAGRSVRIAADAAARYESFTRTPATWNPLGPAEEIPAAHTGLLDTIAELVAGVPAPLAALDHVQATPETVLRRALWLDARYDLATSRLLFLGDHDLTSLAVRALRPDADVTVVDLDERLLTYVDDRSGRAVRAVHADLRVGLPAVVSGAADLVFSDPPYTPEGMALFAARGLACLADPALGRLLLAYGYSPRHPALGAQVQRNLANLGLTFEAIVPDFNRYLGAQAIGSAADLYVCQPTAQAAKGPARKTGIYTHGPQSVESGRATPALLSELAEIASAGGATPEARKPDWSKPIQARPGTALTFDLTDDPGPWLLRVLLAANADRVVALVPNAHPDLASADAQGSLAGLVGSKYRLRYLRSTPDNTHAVVVADAVPAGEAHPAVGAVLSRAHGRLTNVGREALVSASDGAMTKNSAREALATVLAGLDGFRLIDVPRHRLAELLPALQR